MGEKKIITGKVLKWGNSYGIRLRREDVARLKLNERGTVTLSLIEKENPLKELRGLFKGKPLTREEFLKTRKEIEGVDKWQS